MPEDDPPAGTFGRELSLPRVPLPSLEDSCARFLEWCEPLLDEDQLRETRAAVATDLAEGSAARRLHTRLERYDAEPGVHSWLDEFWADRYLGRRDRIALNANFFFLFNDTPLGQVERAADLVVRAVSFKRLVDEERLPPDTRRGQPLSMEQFKYVFSATRIPRVDRDEARTPFTSRWPGPSRARHVVVLHGGRIFRLDVVAPDGRRYGAERVAERLREVVAEPARDVDAIGHLTTRARATWAADRQRLLAADDANPVALETVETALFVLALDGDTPVDQQDACEQLLHGNSADRWFDKAVSLVVFADGTAGINGEHCRLDGTTIIRLVESLVSPDSEGSQEEEHTGRPALAPVEVVLSDELRRAVDTAAVEFREAAAGTATLTVSLPGHGTDAAKAAGVSPDAFTHMAFQVAHARARGRSGTTYESISTRHLRHGRTEAMRVVTPAVLRLVEAMGDEHADAGRRRDALLAAVEAHVARARECQAGDAPEQHLWELELLQRRARSPDVAHPPAVVSSPGWSVMRDDWLSTSSVPSQHVQQFGFGATSTTCIGIGYALLPDRLNMFLSTPREVAEQLPPFVEQVSVALAELASLLA